ncbi:uncharacterized protein [Anabrus simplex]|uniref:uncharacterized protein isoform X2 n=1 Tax=Anabrus simplex TaxID=316456 RepID=UPI0035A37ED0
MDLEVEIKDEPIWLEGTVNSSLMSNLLLPNADDTLAEVKIEPLVFADQTVEETSLSTVKEEYEIKVPNLLLPPADDTVAEVRIEPWCVFTNEVVEEAGVILLKEEYEIKDEKKEIQDAAFKFLVNTIHVVEHPTEVTGGKVHSCIHCFKTFRVAVSELIS